MPLLFIWHLAPPPSYKPFWPGVGGVSIEAEATLRLPPGPSPVARGRGGGGTPFRARRVVGGGGGGRALGPSRAGQRLAPSGRGSRALIGLRQSQSARAQTVLQQRWGGASGVGGRLGALVGVRRGRRARHPGCSLPLSRHPFPLGPREPSQTHAPSTPFPEDVVHSALLVCIQTRILRMRKSNQPTDRGRKRTLPLIFN